MAVTPKILSDSFHSFVSSTRYHDSAHMRTVGRVLEQTHQLVRPMIPVERYRPLDHQGDPHHLPPLGYTYPGDFLQTSVVRYSPLPDGKPDPGEIVWTWVPYEEDHSQGKDRPVLLVGRERRWLLALMLTTKDHIHRSGDIRRNNYIEIGTGPWDRQRRPSEIRVDRVLRVSPSFVRREGGVLDIRRFEPVAQALVTRYGWKRNHA